MQLYVSIAGLAYFYLGNCHTLSAVFARDLLATKAKVERLSHMTDLVLGYLLRGDGGAAPSRADDPDHPSDEASADEPSEDPADPPEADAPPTTPDPGAARAQASAGPPAPGRISTVSSRG